MSDEPAIEFSEDGQPASINYSVPLPGAHTGRRIMEIDVELKESEYVGFEPTKNDGLANIIGALQDSNGNYRVDDSNAFNSFVRSRTNYSDLKLLKTKILAVTTGNTQTEEDEEQLLYQSNVIIPVYKWGGAVVNKAFPLDGLVKPRLFIIEKYGVSSFLGDYGMGRTVKTFTLLPGESTKISLKTWLTTSESRKSSSSIIDSHEESAKERFADTVKNETTDKKTSSSKEEWHVDASVEASWGFGEAKVSGGGSGEYSSGREEFGKQLGESVKEHASDASSKRELSVTSSSEQTSESGTESLIERTITNVNMRRVLNFVFRELNQEYTTKIHLKDIRIAFSNSKVGSWEEVSISGLLPLLKKHVTPGKIDNTAKKILKAVGIMFDHSDTPTFTLDKVEISSDGSEININDAQLDQDGEFPAPKENSYYRFKSGPFNQKDEPNPVEGVLLSEHTITMRTDSVLVEALLGQADALDEYAMEIQKATADKSTIDNAMAQLIMDTANEIQDPKERSDALAKMISASHISSNSDGD